jgi:Domain of unknown function (DUF4389)
MRSTANRHLSCSLQRVGERAGLGDARLAHQQLGSSLVRRDRHTGFVARHHPGLNRFRRSGIQHRAGRTYGWLPAAGPFNASSPRPQQRRSRVQPHIAQRPRGPVDSALAQRFSPCGLPAQPGRQRRPIAVTPWAPRSTRRRQACSLVSPSQLRRPVVITGRYPRPLFSFSVGYLRWNYRVIAYAFLLATDKYPPFRLGA